MFWRRGTSSVKKPKKPPGRKRIAAGWVLLAFAVLVTGVWGASRWWWLQYKYGNFWMELTRGAVRVIDEPSGTVYANMPAGWSGPGLRDEPSIAWRALDFETIGWRTQWDIVVASQGFNPSEFRMWDIVLWPFALASLLGGGWLVWAGRRARKHAVLGCCRKCGYDLVGLGAGAPCPECGAGR